MIFIHGHYNKTRKATLLVELLDVISAVLNSNQKPGGLLCKCVNYMDVFLLFRYWLVL